VKKVANMAFDIIEDEIVSLTNKIGGALEFVKDDVENLLDQIGDDCVNFEEFVSTLSGKLYDMLDTKLTKIVSSDTNWSQDDSETLISIADELSSIGEQFSGKAESLSKKYAGEMSDLEDEIADQIDEVVEALRDSLDNIVRGLDNIGDFALQYLSSLGDMADVKLDELGNFLKAKMNEGVQQVDKLIKDLISGRKGEVYLRIVQNIINQVLNVINRKLAKYVDDTLADVKTEIGKHIDSLSGLTPSNAIETITDILRKTL